MIRFVSIAVAASALFVSAGATAQGAAYYAATPVAAPAKAGDVIASGTIWKWRNAAFFAGKSNSRDAIVCEQVVQRTGKLSGFSAGGAAFDEAKLAKCNARAK